MLVESLADLLPVCVCFPTYAEWPTGSDIPSKGPKQETGCGRLLTSDTPCVADSLENTPGSVGGYVFASSDGLKTKPFFL